MVTEILSMYHQSSINDEHHRFKSWEHCYGFFSKNYQSMKNEEIFDHSCLHLAFYLASWGMLRGSSFLLQKDYKVHQYFVKNVVMNPENFRFYHQAENYLLEYNNIEGMDILIAETKKVYPDHVQEISEEFPINVTDTLASKILLGVYGNVPAYDRYFKDGLTLFGIRIQFDELSLKQLVDFYHQYEKEFISSIKLFSNDGVVYTPMKLIDMYFWQIGFMKDNLEMYIDDIKAIMEFANHYKLINRKHNVEKSNYHQRTEAGTSNTGCTNEIRKYIISILNAAKHEGKEYLDLRSGDIHKAMGLRERLPSVCNAMESLGTFKFSIIKDTPSGKSSTKLVRYFLN